MPPARPRRGHAGGTLLGRFDGSVGAEAVQPDLAIDREPGRVVDTGDALDAGLLGGDEVQRRVTLRAERARIDVDV